MNRTGGLDRSGTVPRARRDFARAAAQLIALGALACGTPDARAPERSGGDTTATPVVLADVPLMSGDSTPVVALPPILPNACVRSASTIESGWSLEGIGDGSALLERRALSTLPPRDSARLAARLARVVDALPSDTTLADFGGLPVVVREAWRLAPAAGDTVIVAFVDRRLPIESNPLEESFTLVATPGSRQGVRDPLIAQWHVRQVGREEALDPRDFVAAITRDDARTSLLFVRERPTGFVLDVVTRTDGRWVLEWSGTIARCG